MSFPVSGLFMPNLIPNAMIPKLTISGSMHLSRCHIGEPKTGFTMKIREAGFNGIAAITWGAVVMMISGKSSAGKICVVMLRKLKETVSLGT